MADQVTQSSLIIGEGVVFTGTIYAPGTASINGTVNGEVHVSDLQIGPKGNVAGKIEAKVIDVHGLLSDNILCHDHILIHRTGSVSGQLDYSDIEIERGGQFKGNMVQHANAKPANKPLDSQPVKK
ncbi:MAG: polymer-forming cytoskeletal protein [Burkholderiales bacterium]|nr:polymer-forming cytoskeletal protein [Burkholderiales bacterium]